jgi:hypothetical protein
MYKGNVAAIGRGAHDLLRADAVTDKTGTSEQPRYDDHSQESKKYFFHFCHCPFALFSQL